MQLQEAQELVRRACQILLVSGGGILIYLGILKLKNQHGRKICRDAVILGFLAESDGPGALCCPVVNLGEDDVLRPVVVQTLKHRWKQSVGQTISVRFVPGDFSHVTLAEETGRKGFATMQLVCGIAVVIIFGMRLLGAV